MRTRSHSPEEGYQGPDDDLPAQELRTGAQDPPLIFLDGGEGGTGEDVRRLALAIRQYRLPAGAKSFAVIHQQNVATGDQKVSYTDRSSEKGQTFAFWICLIRVVASAGALTTPPSTKITNGRQANRRVHREYRLGFTGEMR